MDFFSDNCAGAHPDIVANLTKHATGYSASYGTSDFDASIQKRLSDIFERDVAVFYVATGTAANSLALASVAKPGGIALAHREAHLIVDECGAPEYLSGQLRMAPVDGPDGKMKVSELRQEAQRITSLDVHGGRLNAISVSQPTESGTVYSLQELDDIAAIAKEHNVPVHMDGARFANGLVSLGCTPAEMTWKRGVEILSFGGTKNGCWCAEAVILFDPAKAQEFAFLQKRAAQLFSKSRFISAQFEAYLHDALWLDLARHANKMTEVLATALDRSPLARLIRWPQGNEIFVVLKKSLGVTLQASGVVFSEWPVSRDMLLREDEQFCRFVTSFATKKEDIARLMELMQGEQ